MTLLLPILDPSIDTLLTTFLQCDPPPWRSSWRGDTFLFIPGLGPQRSKRPQAGPPPYATAKGRGGYRSRVLPAYRAGGVYRVHNITPLTLPRRPNPCIGRAASCLPSIREHT